MVENRNLFFKNLLNALCVTVKTRGDGGRTEVRGHSTTTWTEFCNFLTPPLPSCVDSFYTLSVDKKRHFFTPPPLILST